MAGGKEGKKKNVSKHVEIAPPAVFYVGMWAVAGAAMSSTDWCLLAATSIFTNSIYKTKTSGTCKAEKPG